MSDYIFEDSPEAATYRTDIKGWVSRHGKYYGDGALAEEPARLAGATHRKCCECGSPVAFPAAACPDCVLEKNRRVHLARTGRPVSRHDKMYYSWVLNEFFDEIDDLVDEHVDPLKEGFLDVQALLDELCVTHCDPVYADLDCSSFEHRLDHDSDPPQALLDAIASFNEAMKDIPLSYIPSQIRVLVEEQS